MQLKTLVEHERHMASVGLCFAVRAFTEAGHILSPEHFINGEYGRVWRHAMMCAANGRDTDPLEAHEITGLELEKETAVSSHAASSSLIPILVSWHCNSPFELTQDSCV